MTELPPNFELSERFERALAKAVEIHRNHARKGSGVPYVGHLLSVAGLEEFEHEVKRLYDIVWAS